MLDSATYSIVREMNLKWLCYAPTTVVFTIEDSPWSFANSALKIGTKKQFGHSIGSFLKVIMTRMDISFF